MKYILFFLLGVVLTAGGLLLYFTMNLSKKDATQTVVTPPVIVQSSEPQPVDLVEIARNSKNRFTYLVTNKDANEVWDLVLNDNFFGTFFFQYKFFPWGWMRTRYDDLTATDGEPPPHAFAALGTYNFCAGEYYCDLQLHQGMGFELTFWDPEYSERDRDPEFYLKNGEILVMRNEKFIITYTPFQDSSCQSKNAVLPTEYCDKQQANINKNIADLFTSFTFVPRT